MPRRRCVSVYIQENDEALWKLAQQEAKRMNWSVSAYVGWVMRRHLGRIVRNG
jgi:hypothetical protein